MRSPIHYFFGDKKTRFELHFERNPRSDVSNLKNPVRLIKKNLSFYITRTSAVEITDHLVMSRKKTNDLKYRR